MGKELLCPTIRNKIISKYKGSLENFQASMPPGWTKSVNSACLMDSFSVVDKIKWNKKKSTRERTCQTCVKRLMKEKMDKSKVAKAEKINKMTELLLNEQVEQFLAICYDLVELRNSEIDREIDERKFADFWSVAVNSPYLTHLFHFTQEELADLCLPVKEITVISNLNKIS